MSVKLTLIISLFVSVVLYCGCTTAKKNEVLVIEKTKVYHTDQCARVRMAHTRIITIEEARNLNCQPCPGCHPDTNS